MKKLTQILIGAVLVACGVIYILGAFGIADINISLDGWWTLFIIIPCLSGLFTSKDKFGNLIGLLTGVLLLLAAQEVFEYDIVIKVVVPAIIILLGIKLIAKSTSTKKDYDNYDDEGKNERMAAFSSKSFNYAQEEIKVAKIGAVFGGAECNLTDAKIENGSQLDLFCAFGGADIIVPEDVNIKINTFCLFGGISDKRNLKSVDKNNPTLTINGFCMFGGADIK